MGSLDPADRPLVGAQLNEVTSECPGSPFPTADRTRRSRTRRGGSPRIESTSPSRRPLVPTGIAASAPADHRRDRGHLRRPWLHGRDGPEAELGWYNFDALNTPPTHPSRLESDTLYLDYGDPADEVLLRTQTSPVQVRWMEHAPASGLCRGAREGLSHRSTTDATHLPVFHQIEGLAVDDSIQFSDLEGNLGPFSREFFGPETTVRLPAPFLPVHRAQRRALRLLLRLRRRRAGVPGLWRSGLAGDAGLRAWSTPTCSRRSATTPPRSPGSPSGWVSSGWPWCATGSTTSVTSSTTTSAS